MSDDAASQDVTTATSGVWRHLIAVPDTPDGFTVRTAYPTNPEGAEVMLEGWLAGTAEPPHYHPGDDMTVVVEGRVSVQFYRREGDRLEPDGGRVVLERGDAGYIRAGRIHDVAYVEPCRLVYVHDGPFAFHLAEAAQD